MYQKRPGVFMADWWDADGRRHRKQFANAASAREHEHRETALAHAERASREMKLARTGSVKRSTPKTDSGSMEPAKGKLGVMIPGMGAVATTFVAGVEAIRKGLAKPIGSLTQMGTIRLGKRTDGTLSEGEGIRSAGWARRFGFHRLGYFRRQHVRIGDERGRAGLSAARAVEAVSVIDQAAPRGVRSQLCQENRRSQREEGQVEDGSGRATARRHQGLQEDEWREPADHDVVRIDRVVH